MQNFIVMNEILLFKDATVLFKFNIPKDKTDYLLYYVTNLESYDRNVLVAALEKEENGYVYVRDIDSDRVLKVKSYIEGLLDGNADKKEIKINRDVIDFEPNICQAIIENDRRVECYNIDDFCCALSNLDDEYFNSYVYVKDLNKVMCDFIIGRNNILNKTKRKEDIKGNINIFLLTLFTVCFLIVLIFVGYGSLIAS